MSSSSYNSLVKFVDRTFTAVEYVYKIYAVVLTVFVFMSPCQLPFLGSLLLTTCSGWYFSFVLIRLALDFFEFMFLSHLLVSVTPYVILILMCGIIFLWNGCQRSLGNPMRYIYRANYRKLLILEKLVNACVRYRIFPIVAMGCPIVEIVGCSVIIKLHSTLEMSQLVSLMILFFYCTIYNVLFINAAGIIHSKSVAWLVEANKGCWRNKILRREIQSTMPLRLWFGANFVDGLTTLVIQNFCVNQTISLLLL